MSSSWTLWSNKWCSLRNKLRRCKKKGNSLDSKFKIKINTLQNWLIKPWIAQVKIVKIFVPMDKAKFQIPKIILNLMNITNYLKMYIQPIKVMIIDMKIRELKSYSFNNIKSKSQTKIEQLRNYTILIIYHQPHQILTIRMRTLLTSLKVNFKWKIMGISALRKLIWIKWGQFLNKSQTLYHQGITMKMICLI